MMNLIDKLVELGYVQGEVQNKVAEAPTPTLFTQLTTSQESLDKFQSSVKSAADAYATLLSGNGSIPEYASDTPLAEIGSMYMKSGEFVPKYRGNAYAEGTGKHQGLPEAEKNALVSEYGQTEMTVLPNGDTIITDEPTLMDLPKDTVIFNEEQTKQIMGNKVDVSGKAYASGIGINTIDHEIVLKDGTRLRPIQPGDRAWEMQKAFEPLLNRWLSGEQEILSNAFFDGQKQMEQLTKEIINNTAISNVTNKNIQQPVTVNQNITLNCPNVTNDSGVEYLQKEFGHLSLMAIQEPLRKY